MVTHFEYEQAKKTIADYEAERRTSGYVLLEDGLLVPEYVKTSEGAVLILDIRRDTKQVRYYRPAGVWAVTFVIKQDKIICSGGVSNLVGEELLLATQEEFLKSNEGYV